MKPFEALTLAEDFRQQRFVATSNRCLRYELLLRRKVLEAELAERRLQAISSLRVFQRLRREARVLLSVQLVRERSKIRRVGPSGDSRANGPGCGPRDDGDVPGSGSIACRCRPYPPSGGSREHTNRA